MAYQYHIEKNSTIDPSIVVYYVGENRWSDDYSQRSKFTSESAAQSLMDNPDGKNGGWSGASIIREWPKTWLLLMRLQIRYKIEIFYLQ